MELTSKEILAEMDEIMEFIAKNEGIKQLHFNALLLEARLKGYTPTIRRIEREVLVNMGFTEEQCDDELSLSDEQMFNYSVMLQLRYESHGIIPMHHSNDICDYEDFEEYLADEVVRENMKLFKGACDLGLFFHDEMLKDERAMKAFMTLLKTTIARMHTDWIQNRLNTGVIDNSALFYCPII